MRKYTAPLAALAVTLALAAGCGGSPSGATTHHSAAAAPATTTTHVTGADLVAAMPLSQVLPFCTEAHGLISEGFSADAVYAQEFKAFAQGYGNGEAEGGPSADEAFSALWADCVRMGY